jgi:hypothetical protein
MDIFFKKILTFSILLGFLTGCTTTCILIKSEYYDITGSVLVPKEPGQEILIFSEGDMPKEPYQEIGKVKVMAKWGTTKEAMNQEMKKRARQAGADALMDVQYGEDKANDIIFCGRLLSTKRNQAASGRAVIFINKK